MSKNTSFLRWAGGKTWLVPFIEQLTQGLDFNNYFEPFMGGASIFFSLNIPGTAYLSDINDELVNAFCAVRDNPRLLVSYLRNMPTDADSYYAIRKSEPRGKYQRAARFIYLNATSFNGLYRVNRDGKYNVPYGQKEVKINCERLRDISGKLQNAVIECHDFAANKEQIRQGDLVFLDPPYTVSKESNCFIEYNATLFSLEDQYRLGELIDHINEVGAYYILTNAAHDTIKEIFQGRGRLLTFERNSLIGGKNSYRGKVQEYIFTNIGGGGTIDEQN